MPKLSCGRASSLDFRSSDSTRPCSSGANLPIFRLFFGNMELCQPREPTTDMSNDPKKIVHPGDMRRQSHNFLVATRTSEISMWHEPFIWVLYKFVHLGTEVSQSQRKSTMGLSEHRVQTSKHVHTHASLCSPIMSGNFRTVSLNPYLAPQSSMGCRPGRQDHLNVSLWITWSFWIT